MSEKEMQRLEKKTDVTKFIDREKRNTRKEIHDMEDDLR